MIINLPDGGVLVNGKLVRRGVRRDSFGRRMIRVGRMDLVIEPFDLPDDAPPMIRPEQYTRTRKARLMRKLGG